MENGNYSTVSMKERCLFLPIESIEIEVLDAPITDLVTWLPLKSKKYQVYDFKALDWKGNKEVLISTHPKNQAILNEMINMIASARNHVFLCNWMLQYYEIEEALESAANRLNGRVHVLTTLETNIHSRYFNDEESMNSLSRLQNLAGNGIYIRLHPEAHAKFLITDDKLLVTSANIRDTSLEENIETGVLVSDSETVKTFHSFFSYLWLHEAKQHIRPSKNDPRLGNPWSQPNAVDLPRAIGNAIWTLDNRRTSLANAIIDTIKSAKKTLRISTYILSNTESGIGKRIVDELINASQKGVEIKILYHATNIAIGRPPRKEESNGFLRLMSSKKISIRGHPDLHAKHVIADNTSGLLFTANLDGNHGLNTGIEVGVKLSKEASECLSEWHDILFDSFPLELVISPKISELYNRKGTKLVQLPYEIMISSVKQFDKIKQSLFKVSEKSTIICNRPNRWIEPENKGDRWTPKPYESGLVVPSIDSGFLLDEINLISEGEYINVELSEHSNFGLHHAHIAPGKYNLSILKPYTDDEIIELIEQYLPVPKEGVSLRKIFNKFKGNLASPYEVSFNLDLEGFVDYIQRNKKRGLLRVHEIKKKKIFPVAKPDTSE